MNAPASGSARRTPVGAQVAVGTGARLRPEEVLDRLAGRFGDKVRRGGQSGREPFAVVDREHVLAVLAFLRDDPALRFDFLADVTAVDHLLLEVPEIQHRFAVVYLLASLVHGHRFEVKTPVPEEDPRVGTASSLWRSALWGEREAHDMFGIEFDGHPDLRRLLMPQNYPGFPLRKDYPLRGRGERDAFPQYRPGGLPADPHERQGAAILPGDGGA